MATFSFIFGKRLMLLCNFSLFLMATYWKNNRAIWSRWWPVSEKQSCKVTREIPFVWRPNFWYLSLKLCSRLWLFNFLLNNWLDSYQDLSQPLVIVLSSLETTQMIRNINWRDLHRNIKIGSGINAASVKHCCKNGSGRLSIRTWSRSHK